MQDASRHVSLSNNSLHFTHYSRFEKILLFPFHLFLHPVDVGFVRACLYEDYCATLSQTTTKSTSTQKHMMQPVDRSTKQKHMMQLVDRSTKKTHETCPSVHPKKHMMQLVDRSVEQRTHDWTFDDAAPFLTICQILVLWWLGRGRRIAPTLANNLFHLHTVRNIL